MITTLCAGFAFLLSYDIWQLVSVGFLADFIYDSTALNLQF